MALRLGRDSTAASCASNLAICHLRAGNVSKQLEWADISLRIGESHASHINGRLHATYCRALALAINGPAQGTREYLRDSDNLIEAGAPRWMVQLWQLFKADVLATIGAQSESAQAARITIDFGALGALASHYVGTYCRWCARSAATLSEREAARSYVTQVAEHLDSHDALDQAEILLSMLLVGQAHLNGESVRNDLQHRLATLPAGVAAHFERLGMLPVDELATRWGFLVDIQLNIPNREQPRQGVLSGPGAPVPVADVAGDADAASVVGRVVGIGQGKALRDPKLRFDEVQPGGLGRGIDRRDPEVAQEPQETGVVVHVGEVVENHVEATPGVAGPEAAEGARQVDDPLALGEDTREAIGVDIVEAEEVLDPVRAPIRRPHPMGLAPGGPGAASQRP